jgi:hypothetical protein
MTTLEMATTLDIAHDLVALCRVGRFDEAGERHWADNVVSIEPRGETPVSRGKDAVRGKGEWWGANHDVHGVAVEGPYVNRDQFVVRFRLDVTPRATGRRTIMDETGLYTTRGGKIVEERFFVGG